MPPDFQIRWALQEDFPVINEIRTDSIKALACAYYSQEIIESWSAPKSLKDYEDAAAQGEIYFVAVDNLSSEICLGFSSYLFDDGDHAVRAVYVRGNSARRGVGSALLREVEQYACGAGAEDLCLEASLAAVDFYLYHGYEIIKRYSREIHGLPSECISMKKVLRMRKAVDYALRIADAGDFLFYKRCHHEVMWPYVEAIWGWDDVDQDRRVQESFGSYEPGEIKIIQVFGKDIGVFSLERKGDDLFIAQLWLLPEGQGQGIGTTIIRSVIDRACKENLGVSLRVLRGNNRAKALYERLGFDVYDEDEGGFFLRYKKGCSS